MLILNNIESGIQILSAQLIRNVAESLSEPLDVAELMDKICFFISSDVTSGKLNNGTLYTFVKVKVD